LALDQTGSLNDRKLAFADKFQDLFIMYVRSTGQGQRSNNQRTRKICIYLLFLTSFCNLKVSLGTNIGSFRWNDKNAMLAGIADGKLNIWLYPNVVFVDQSLIDKTTYRIESRYIQKKKYFCSMILLFSDFGKNPSISDFLSCQITIRKSTGALIQSALPIYYELCLDLLTANRAEEALQLCQYIAVEKNLFCVFFLFYNNPILG
jgi:hypothetical protein